jgi:hypothetical protein
MEQGSENLLVLVGMPDFVTEDMRQFMKEDVHQHIFVVIITMFILHTNVDVLLVDRK